MSQPKVIQCTNKQGVEILAIWNPKPILMARDTYQNDGEIGKAGDQDVLISRNPDYCWSFVTDRPLKNSTREMARPIQWATEWDVRKKLFRDQKICIHARQEHNHKVACCKPGVHVNSKGECLCEEHRNKRTVAKGWFGYIKGAA